VVAVKAIGPQGDALCQIGGDGVLGHPVRCLDQNRKLGRPAARQFCVELATEFARRDRIELVARAGPDQHDPLECPLPGRQNLGDLA